jgi:hypothetical protein
VQDSFVKITNWAQSCDSHLGWRLAETVSNSLGQGIVKHPKAPVALRKEATDDEAPRKFFRYHPLPNDAQVNILERKNSPEGTEYLRVQVRALRPSSPCVRIACTARTT